jgi:hypothetical protein
MSPPRWGCRRRQRCGCHRSGSTEASQHPGYLETQLALVEQFGEALYVARLVEQPSSESRMLPNNGFPDDQAMMS